MAKTDGGQAFPALQTLTTHDAQSPHTVKFAALNIGGMSLRDYFATAAMQAALHPEFLRASDEARGLRGDAFLAFIAESAYGMADAMLAAREK